MAELEEDLSSTETERTPFSSSQSWLQAAVKDLVVAKGVVVVPQTNSRDETQRLSLEEGRIQRKTLFCFFVCLYCSSWICYLCHILQGVVLVEEGYPYPSFECSTRLTADR